MYRDRRRRRPILALTAALVTAVASLSLPATALACLPGEAASNFSFSQRLAFAVSGRITAVEDVGEQEHARVTVTVESVIAGTPEPILEVVMDPGGGCTHPRGEVGDAIVLAAGAPGADYGVFSPWTSGYLSPYNSAAWIIGIDGTITSGPTIDGHQFAGREELLSALRSLAEAAPTPSDQAPIVLFGLPLLTVLLSLVYWILGWWPHPTR